MDIKLPCVRSLEEYWEALCSKKVSFCEIPDSQKALLLPHNNATTVKYCSEVVHGDIGMFDYNYFGISQSEAKEMDPQHKSFWSSLFCWN